MYDTHKKNYFDYKRIPAVATNDQIKEILVSYTAAKHRKLQKMFFTLFST